jgi:hypothetical protein
LHDAARAQELAIYKPFGDYGLRKLAGLRSEPAADRYNSPLGFYAERDKWACPLYAVIRFFDIMVLEALHQDIQWHMWLYYYPHFVKDILFNLAPHDSVELEREWPTPYHYLLYEIISNLCTW